MAPAASTRPCLPCWRLRSAGSCTRAVLEQVAHHFGPPFELIPGATVVILGGFRAEAWEAGAAEKHSRVPKEKRLIFILGALPRRPGVAAGLAALCLLAMGVLAGCNTNYNLGATGSVGIGNNVAITTAGNVTQLYQGGSITVTATTANDTTNAGVTFTLSQGSKGYICAQSV